MRGIALATPSPSTGPRGHIVDDRFQEAFPDEFDSAGAASPYLYATAALAILVLVRRAWVMRHW